jgi:small-conductance mechanosensitive channel
MTSRRPASGARRGSTVGRRKPVVDRRSRLVRPPRPKARLTQARSVLRRFRRASLLAVAITSLLLLLVGLGEPEAEGAVADEAPVALAEESEPERGPPPSATDTGDDLAESTRDAPARDRAEAVAKATGEEAGRTFAELRDGVVRNAPKIALVTVILLAAWGFVRIFRLGIRRALGDWARATAVTALTGVVVWLSAVGLSITILAGDVRAFVGSVGLLGLALSWALQTPIESFTGWLLNAFKGYYRVGDRVEVGEVFGDVHRIDVLTTTVWEIGSPFRSGFVHAEQPTGRLITFPNNQILTGSVMNFTRDFAFVWDELTVPIANESDVRYAMGILDRIARELLGERMTGPAREYETILRGARLEESVSAAPEVFVSLDDSWTNLSIRYLVDARRRRKWKSELVLRVAEELGRPEHHGRIIPVVPRRQIQLVGPDGLPRDLGPGAPAAPPGDEA